MNLARLLRFFGLRSRHSAAVGHHRRSRLSIRMSRVFHRHSSLRRSTVESAATAAGATTTPRRDCVASPPASRMAIPENEPVALEWGQSSSHSMDLRKSSRADDLERRLLVQRLILEELQSHARRSSASASTSASALAARESRLSLVEHAAALSHALLEARGAEALPPAPLSRRDEKKLRKSVARAVRADEKQQRKLDKLNRKRAQQYARAHAFFEHQRGSFYRGSVYDRARAASICSSSSTSPRRALADSGASARSGSRPPRMEFLFFGGCADGGSVSSELELWHRRFAQQQQAQMRLVDGALERFGGAESIHVPPTLARNLSMPRPFAPRMQRRGEVFI